MKKLGKISLFSTRIDLYKKIYFVFCIILYNTAGAQIDFSQFTGENVNAYISTQMSDIFIYDYKINASNKDSIVSNVLSGNSSEAILTEQYENLFSKNNDDKINNYIVLMYRLKFNYFNVHYCLIKYKKVENESESAFKIFLLKQTDRGGWEKHENDELFKDKIYAMKVLSTEIFWEFYSKKDDIKYPEINKLKPLVKDANGILNIEKLAEVIKDNKAVLSKYLDQ